MIAPLQKHILRTLLQNEPNTVSLDLELSGVGSELSDVPTTSDNALCILQQAQKVCRYRQSDTPRDRTKRAKSI